SSTTNTVGVTTAMADDPRPETKLSGIGISPTNPAYKRAPMKSGAWQGCGQCLTQVFFAERLEETVHRSIFEQPGRQALLRLGRDENDRGRPPRTNQLTL